VIPVALVLACFLFVLVVNAELIMHLCSGIMLSAAPSVHLVKKAYEMRCTQWLVGEAGMRRGYTSPTSGKWKHDIF
jgi:hypothetical protein